MPCCSLRFVSACVKALFAIRGHVPAMDGKGCYFQRSDICPCFEHSLPVWRFGSRSHVVGVGLGWWKSRPCICNEGWRDDLTDFARAVDHNLQLYGLRIHVLCCTPFHTYFFYLTRGYAERHLLNEDTSSALVRRQTRDIQGLESC